MENDKKFKMNFFTLFITILVLLAIVLLTAILFKNDGKNGRVSNNINTTNTMGNTIAISDDNYDDTSFSFKFLKMKNNKANMIYSPLSIKYALNMLNDGANGNTKKQIEAVIGNDGVQKYDDIDDILSLANALYIRDTYVSSIKESYNDVLRNKYNAEIKEDAFKDAKNINSWIENKTFGQIKDMLSDQAVSNPANRMILVNALAIDMEWEEKFEEENTGGRDFYKEDGEKVTATTMNKDSDSENVSYYKDDEITVLSMDLKEYEDVQMEYMVIMPEDNLKDYIDHFNTDVLNKLSKKLKKASDATYGINISMPRFSYDFEWQLNNDLQELGIVDAFDPNLANFSNITDDEGLYVGEAIHKATIVTSEKGIKASAATVIYMKQFMAAIEGEPVDITINKPFMYVVRDKNTKEIWFAGTVYEPNLWENDKADYQRR